MNSIKTEICHILRSLGYVVIPKYILKEKDAKTLRNLLIFSHYAAKKAGRTDLIKKGN